MHLGLILDKLVVVYIHICMYSALEDLCDYKGTSGGIVREFQGYEHTEPLELYFFVPVGLNHHANSD